MLCAWGKVTNTNVIVFAVTPLLSVLGEKQQIPMLQAKGATAKSICL
jgi:hypothetical protein